MDGWMDGWEGRERERQKHKIGNDKEIVTIIHSTYHLPGV